MNKKTVLIHSNFCKAFTGFGKHKKNILRYLFKTGKYNIVEFANGRHWQDPELQSMPWQCFGSLPDPSVFLQIKDPAQQRAAGYGSMMIDKVIQETKPDVYIGVEDIWAFDGFYQKPWWNKINTMIWTTLDSLPILQSAVDAAPKIKNYYVWASFAEKAMKQMGYDHVKTLRGSLDANQFFRFDDEQRTSLRKRFGLSDSYIIGFVFRNQLRKSVPNMLDGFKLFKQQVPHAKLLLHTHWSEGWDIPRLLEEKGIDPNDILTTYFCQKCKQYEIKSYSGQSLDCRFCGGQKTVNTTNISQGVDEIQLNEIYNLMDVYCHPFTSGGQEIPIQEAKLTELITLVTNYSCGEDYCNEDSGGLPLEWSEYREPGTQFIKASTSPQSIFEQLVKVYNMPPIQRTAWGLRARQFVIDHCSIEAIGKQLEEIIDAMPEVNYDFNAQPKPFNSLYEPVMTLNNEQFIIDLHKNMLYESIDKNHTVVKHWLSEMKRGLTKEQFFEHIRNICIKQNQAKPIEFEDVLDKDDKGRRIGIVVPESETDVLLINALVKNLKKEYPKHNIYVITRPSYFELIEDNIFVHKCIAYSESIDNPSVLEGIGDYEGYFDLAFFPTVTTQKIATYLHNGKQTTQFALQ
jgi:glycosyltransferase involved in cell wall biosynthesis